MKTERLQREKQKIARAECSKYVVSANFAFSY